jgi:hypothetical protein
MSRGFLSWLIVLFVAVGIGALVVGHYRFIPTLDVQRSSGVTGTSDSDTVGDDADRGPDQAEPISNALPHARVAANGSGNGNGSPYEGKPKTFQDWLQQYVAEHPDPHRLRQELEAALAHLPTNGGPPTTPEAIEAFEALRRAEQTVGDDYATLVDEAERFLEVYSDSPLASEVRELFAKYSRAWDERDFESAREFSMANPDRFQARIARYQTYLERHAAGGIYTRDARTAIETIRADWADHDYRAIYEFSRRYPSDIAAVARRVRQFVDDHPSSPRRRAADQFLARYENAAAPGEYRVRVKSGTFARGIARGLSRGPDLAVQIEVAGVRIGRTPVVADSFEPVWNYEFPQNIRWRMGDPVEIRVIDFDYSNRTILKLESADDPLALRYLSGPVHAQGHMVTFECNFEVPTLPEP